MKKFSFYNELSDEGKKLVDENYMEVKMPANEHLFTQGEQCKDILFLTKGEVRVYRSHESGQEITLYFLEPFEQCNVNLNSSFTDTPAVGTAVTQTDIEGFILPSHIVKELHLTQLSYQYYVFKLFAKRLESMAVLIEDVRFKKLDIRLLEWLKNSKTRTIIITHEKLASHIGTSREVVSKMLKELENDKIVKLSRNKIEYLS